MPELAQRYELGELIGRGGMAEVHRAHDRLLDRAVAVKLFWPPQDQAAHQRFDDEAVALARLAHPGLVAIYDVGRLGARPFLVMEFIDGLSLRSRLMTGPLPLDQVISIGAILAEALAHAHERGVVHRDITPSNIMLDQDGMPHLTDFGIARLAGAARITGANRVIGTPAYLAPEQLSGVTASPAVDVYALALVLLECLTGRLEYEAATELDVALARLSQPPRIPAGLPPVFADLLTAMTCADPAERPSAADCAAWLLPEQSGDPLAPLWSTRVSTVLAPITQSHWRALAASVVGIAAVIVTLMLLLNAQQPAARTPQDDIDHAQGAPLTTQPQLTSPTTSRHSRGTLVANEHSVAAITTTPTTTPTTSPTTSGTPPVTTTTAATSTTSPVTIAASSIAPTTSSGSFGPSGSPTTRPKRPGPGGPCTPPGCHP